MVNAQRHNQGIGFISNQTLTGLDTQVELKLTVNPVDAFVVPCVVLNVVQVQITRAKVPAAIIVR